MTISTLIPTYRRPRELERAVRSALGQTFADIEVHVFDNASGDETEAVVGRLSAEDARVHYHLRPSNVGAAENFRLALEAVRTPYFSFLSDDDELLPDFYAAGAQALAADPEALFAVTRVVHEDAHGRRLAFDTTWKPGTYNPPDGLLKMLREGHPNWTGILYRSVVRDIIGGLDARTGTSNDMDYQLRAAAAGRFVVLNVAGARYRHHEAAASGGARLSRVWPTWLLILEHLDSSRQLSPEAREQATTLLRRRLADELFRIGIGAARRGRYSESGAAAAVLRDSMGRPGRAMTIAMAATACRLPPVRVFLSWIAHRRRPYLD